MFISINRFEAKNTAHAGTCLRLCSSPAVEMFKRHTVIHSSCSRYNSTTLERIYFILQPFKFMWQPATFVHRLNFISFYFVSFFAYSFLSDLFSSHQQIFVQSIYKLIIIRKMCYFWLRNEIRCIWLTRAIFVSMMFYENYKTKLFAIWLFTAFYPIR